LVAVQERMRGQRDNQPAVAKPGFQGVPWF
jgi:hypothetical protein